MPTDLPLMSSLPAGYCLSSGYRLSPGNHLVPSDQGWLLYRSDGLFARLRVKPELPAAAADLLSGQNTQLKGLPADELEAFLQALLSQGVIAPITADDYHGKTSGDAAKSTTRHRVCVEGDGPIASRLSELLMASGFESSVTDAACTESNGLLQNGSLPDLVVSCAGWLPDAQFTVRDTWCAEHGVAWHGIYAEGNRFHLGPFWLPDDPRTVRYADARARRLAADAHPDGLEAYWCYLDGGRRVPAPAPPSPAEAALVAGTLAGDILAWAEGRQPPSLGHQLAYDRVSGIWRRHPVLPVPRGLMTEAVP